MKLHFAYNIEKDIENIVNGTKAVNSKKPTKFQNLFTEKYGDNFESEKIKAFIQEQDKINGFDASKEIVAVEERWRIAEPIFIERVEKIFGISYPTPIITVYLTHNERCTYNIEENYFFVKIGLEFSNNTLMHELLHFYTWHAFGKKLLNKGLAKLAYNDIKESLTELLNLEFSDLMNGKPDNGYPQHQEIRAEIKKMWSKSKNINQVIEKFTISKKVIFFDCYRTLLDIRLDKENQKTDKQRGWEEFVNLLAKNHGIKIGASDFVLLLEKRKADFYSDKDKIIHHHNLATLVSEVVEEDLKSKLSEEKIADLIYKYRKISRGYVRLYPKVAETLAKLSEKYTLSIASYTQSSFTQPELKELDIEKYFSYFIFSSDIGFRKESPEFYKKCLQVVGKNPADCVMVGDNYREDVSVPSQLGINTVWIKNPDTYSKHSDLPTTEATGVINLQEFDKLPEVIDGIFKK